MKKIAAFDSIRFIFAIIICIYHTGINIYGYNKLPNLYFKSSYLAVECFFILSGFLLAKSFYNHGSTTSIKDFFVSRVKRLYPEYLFCLIVVFFLTKLFAHHVSSKAFMLNIIMFGGMGGIPKIINGIWYVVILFWVGNLLYIMMSLFKEKALHFFIPLLSALAVFYLVNHGGNISGHQDPIEFKLLSKGTIRGFLGLSVGIFTYMIANFISSLDPKNFNQKRVTFLLRILELFATYSVIYLVLIRRKNGITDFNIYFFFSYIVILLYFKKEFFLKFLSWKIWINISQTAYILYLSHLCLLEIMRKYEVFPQMNIVLMYFVTSLSCIIFACILYVLCKKTTKLIVSYFYNPKKA